MPFGKIEFLSLIFRNCLIYTTPPVDNLYIARIIFCPYGIILKSAAIHTLRFDEIGFDVISRKILLLIDSKLRIRIQILCFELKVYRKFVLKRTTLIQANTISSYSHPGKITQCYVLIGIFENIEYLDMDRFVMRPWMISCNAQWSHMTYKKDINRIALF